MPSSTGALPIFSGPASDRPSPPWIATEPRIRKAILVLVEQEGLPLDRTLMHKLPMLVVNDIFKEEYSEITKRFREVNIGSMKQIVAKRCLAAIDQILVEKMKKEGTE